MTEAQIEDRWKSSGYRSQMAREAITACPSPDPVARLDNLLGRVGHDDIDDVVRQLAEIVRDIAKRVSIEPTGECE